MEGFKSHEIGNDERIHALLKSYLGRQIFSVPNATFVRTVRVEERHGPKPSHDGKPVHRQAQGAVVVVLHRLHVVVCKEICRWLNIVTRL